MIFWENNKFREPDDLLLLFLAKNLFFILGMTHNNAFFSANLTKKEWFLEVLPIYFSKTTGFQHKLLKLIESLNLFHWKSTKRRKWV